MAASKSLILKGISGFAATCLAAAGGFEVKNLFQSSSSNASSLEKNDEDEFEGESREDDDLGIPTGCFTSTTCDLTAEQLRKLKFERRSDSWISFGGLSVGDTFELTVEDSGDSTNYPRGKKYILKAKATTQTVTIEGVKDEDIVLGVEQEGVELREKEGGGRLEKVPEELNNLGIPKRCEGDSDEDSTPKTCELTKKQLLRLKFEPKSGDGSIGVSGLAGKNTVTLTVEEVTGDEKNYPKNKKYTLTSKSGTVTIKGVKDGDIVLEENKGVDLREKSSGDQLETVENSLGIPRRCDAEAPCKLTQKELQKLKFETEGNGEITVNELGDDETVDLTIEDKKDDLTNYPKGKKYTLKVSDENVTIKGVKGGDIVLEAGEEEVVIREKESGGKLEKAPEEVNNLGIPRSCKVDQVTADETQTCELTKEQLQKFKFEAKGNEAILVDGLTEGNTVTLEIGDKSSDINYPKGKKYTLTTTGSNVTIKNVKDGDITITKDKSLGVLIRETAKGGRLEEVVEEVDKLGIPIRCTTREACQLTKEQLQRLKFEQKNSTPIKIEGLNGEGTVELKIEEPKDSTNYPKGKKYTLTSKTGKVTIKGVKGGDVDLGVNQGVVIREQKTGGRLEKGPEEVDELGIPKNCTTGSTCELTRDQLKNLKFETKDNRSSIWISGLGTTYKVELKVENSNDTDNYPQKKKYSFRAKRDGVTIKNTKEWDIDLEKDKEVLIREKSSKGKLETVEDSLGIPKSCKANEVQKRLDTQTCQLNSDQLKNIKFKEFKGKNAHVAVSGLKDTIKLTMSWVEGKGYPGNIKYSFDNTKKEDIKISRSGQEITIVNQKESWFKNEGGQLALVVAKTKAEIKMEEANEILEKLGLGLEKLKLTTGDFSDNNLTKHNKKEVDFYKDDGLKKIQFKEFNGGAETVEGLSNTNKKITVYLDWVGDENKFPKNMKFSFENKSINPDIDLKKNKKIVEIKVSQKGVIPAQNIFKLERQEDKWYLVKS